MAQSIKPKIFEDQAYNRALRLLSVRNRSSQELRRYLSSRGYSRKIVSAVVAKLTEKGLVDDRIFAFERASAVGFGKGWGPKKIRMDLAKKGIAEQLTEEAVAQAYDGLSVDQVIRRIVIKKFGKKVFQPGLELGIKSKIQRYLIGRGFETEDVYELWPNDGS